MFQTKATITGILAAATLLVGVFSPSKEFTDADALVGFASGKSVSIHTEQSNKGLMAFLAMATVGAAAWTLVGNDESAPVAASTGLAGSASPVAPDQPQQAIQGDTLSDFWEQGVELSMLAEQFDLETRRELLDRSLSDHEGGWLERLLCCPCLLVIGRPGSAKSSFAGALAIAREVLLDGLKATIVTDPNAHLKIRDRIWQKHWDLHGANDKWPEIDKAISALYKRFADSQGANYVSSIYDELTAYEGNVNGDRLGGFLPQITSKARAAEEYITLVSHNDTLSCLGGKTGQAKLKDDMVQLNLCSESGKAGQRGKFFATGKGTIEGLNFDDRNKPTVEAITLPRWFDPAILDELFPELYSSKEEPEELPERAYTITPSSVALTPETSQEVPFDSGATYLASRVSAAEHVKKSVDAFSGTEVKLSVILAVAEALSEKKSDTHIIQEVLAMRGRKFSEGRDVLGLIKQTFTNSIED